MKKVLFSLMAAVAVVITAHAAGPGKKYFYFEDVTIAYPGNYSLTEWETDYGWHIYLQHDTETATSLYMDIERLNLSSFYDYTSDDYADFLIGDCQKYYDRYVDEDYRLYWKGDPQYYAENQMAVIGMTGIQYGLDFTGEIVSIIVGSYQFTAFITGDDDASEKEVRDIFLEALYSLHSL